MGNNPISMMLSFSPAGATSASALATLRLIESFLRPADEHGNVAYLVHLVSSSGRAFVVRLIYSRPSLRGEMRDRQMPAVSDRHEAKTEEQTPSDQRRA